MDAKFGISVSNYSYIIDWVPLESTFIYIYTYRPKYHSPKTINQVPTLHSGVINNSVGNSRKIVASHQGSQLFKVVSPVTKLCALVTAIFLYSVFLSIFVMIDVLKYLFHRRKDTISTNISIDYLNKKLIISANFGPI